MSLTMSVSGQGDHYPTHNLGNSINPVHLQFSRSTFITCSVNLCIAHAPFIKPHSKLSLGCQNHFFIYFPQMEYLGDL